MHKIHETLYCPFCYARAYFKEYYPSKIKATGENPSRKRYKCIHCKKTYIAEGDFYINARPQKPSAQLDKVSKLLREKVDEIAKLYPQFDNLFNLHYKKQTDPLGNTAIERFKQDILSSLDSTINEDE